MRQRIHMVSNFTKMLIFEKIGTKIIILSGLTLLTFTFIGKNKIKQKEKTRQGKTKQSNNIAIMKLSVLHDFICGILN